VGNAGGDISVFVIDIALPKLFFVELQSVKIGCIGLIIVKNIIDDIRIRAIGDYFIGSILPIR